MSISQSTSLPKKDYNTDGEIHTTGTLQIVNLRDVYICIYIYIYIYINMENIDLYCSAAVLDNRYLMKYVCA